MSEPFVWSSLDGFKLVRKIVEPPVLSYIPHDHQLEGVCKTLDKTHLFAITPTGSGKTSYYIIYILVVLAVVADPTLCPSTKFPKNPCLLVICPTIPLQLEMAANMTKLGLKVLAINSQTRSEAQRLRNEDLWLTARTHPNVILAGPEQLKSADFKKALRDDDFFQRFCGTGFDEVHLLNSWGAGFRKDFQQMGFLKPRMTEKHNPWILMSATVRDGAPFNNICRLLGLNDNFHLIRRSCARPDLRLIFRDLISPISGDDFPELNFILEEKRPTVVFAKSISLGFRLYAYLLRRGKLSTKSNRLRMYNSLNFESYNAATRDLMSLDANDPNYCQVIIGTDTLSVGVAMRARVDAVLIGDVDDTNELLQKLGPRNLATKLLAEDADATVKPGQSPPDLSMARLIVADCKVQEQNLIYNNPLSDPICSCDSCTENPPPPPPTSCNCSGCFPESTSTSTVAPHASKSSNNIPTKDRLTKLQKAYGTEQLLQLRLEIWRASDQSKYWMYPPETYLSDRLISTILNNFSRLRNLEHIAVLIQPHPLLAAYPPCILEFLQTMKPGLDAVAAARKAENAAKLKAKKAAEAKSNLPSDNLDEIDKDGDSIMADTRVPTAELRYVPYVQFCASLERSRE
ncbi:P-loop containing nucleoside triphosphate hydrolase protein [Mycena rebaudengoi]|nr:P-loop containing nucleoside triphosphate hydrolase protein [Mycena rebaudengoi]